MPTPSTRAGRRRWSCSGFEGEARAWGRIGAGEVLMQRTWAGHVWEARPADGSPCRYRMPFELGPRSAELAAVVGEDCFGSAVSSVK